MSNQNALRRGMAFTEWSDVGRRLARIANGSAWALGDWILYGQEAYGQRYKQALQVTELDYKTLRNYAYVARRFPPARRHPALSLQHHAEVAALDEAEQDLWLSRCETLRWPRRELRRQLAARDGRIVGTDEHVTVRVQISAERERRWREAATVANCPLFELLTRVVDEAADSLLCIEELRAHQPEAPPPLLAASA